MPRLCILPLALLLLYVAPDIRAQSVPTCDAHEHRQFDFWLGEWSVTRRDGGPAGENTITSILKGCALREEWHGTRGSSGTSLNFFDRATSTWHQMWIGDDGSPLWLAGGLDGEGRMVMSSAEADDRIDRLSWTPNADGTVLQIWERSTDGGATWEQVFHGTYRRRSSAR